MMPRVTTEWARLHEVTLGRPFYRIVRPLAETLRDRVNVDVWRKVKAREGQTIEAAKRGRFQRQARRRVRAVHSARSIARGRRTGCRALPSEQRAPARTRTTAPAAA